MADVMTLNCGTCGGSGLVGGHVGQTPENYGEITEPCPDCAVTVDRKPSSTMTLEDVRDWHYTQASYYTAHDREAAARHTAFADAIDAAIKQRERDANNPLKGWIFDKVNMGRGDERYICTPDGANATTVRNESTSDHRERLLWLIADAMAKESGNG